MKMKLKCELFTTNRDYKGKQNTKPLTATIAVGRKNLKKLPYCQICTSSNPSGTYYEIKDNLKIFNRFLEQGKLTLSFTRPPHDVFITFKKSDTTDLKQLMKLLQRVQASQDLDKEEFPLLGANAAVELKKEKDSRCLTINCKKDYPKSFPKTLEVLKVENAGLIRLDRRMLDLENLTTLDLSNNSLQRVLPPDQKTSGSLHNLAVLNLSLNKLTNINDLGLLSPHIHRKLKSLNVAGNQLMNLPDFTCKLEFLNTLNVGNNLLTNLPYNIGDLAPRLKYLNVSGNPLPALPPGVRRMHLIELDVSGIQFRLADAWLHSAEGWRNMMVSSELLEQKNTTNITLLELSARTVVDCHVTYTENDIPRTLKTYMDGAIRCTLCSKVWFRRERLIHFIGEKSLQTNADTIIGYHTVALQMAMCPSKYCWKKLLMADFL